MANVKAMRSPATRREAATTFELHDVEYRLTRSELQECTYRTVAIRHSLFPIHNEPR
jgi:hypothetical protein